MSHVTSVIITCFTLDAEEPDCLNRINAWLDANHYHAPMPSGGMHDLTPHFGGSKHPQTSVFGGAFNYLDIVAFVRFLKSDAAGWGERALAQALIRDEDDDQHFLVTLRMTDYGDGQNPPYWLRELNSLEAPDV